MINFKRQAEIIVGPYGEEGLSLTGHHFTFNVVKTSDGKANMMNVEVYNCSPDTAKLFETTENTIIINAGYFLNVHQLAVGDITQGKTSISGPDRVSSALCGDGLRTLSKSRVSLSYAGSVNAEQIIGDIAAKLGLDLRETEADLAGKFRSGWAFVGPAREAMTAIAKRFNLDWSIQNEEIQITERRGVNTQDAVLITPQTGLIGFPEPLDDDRDDTGEAKEDPGLVIRTLLNPLLEPGGIVVLNTRDYDDAEFRIRRVEHNGDTAGGDWMSIIEVIER